MELSLEEFEVELGNIAECFSEEQNRAVLERAAEYLRELIDERVFDAGEATDGDVIDSVVRADKLYLETGPYSDTHGRARAKAGLGTDLINLQFSGLLRGALITGVSDSDNIGIGFITEAAGQLRRYHEEYRDKAIFTPQDKEADLLVEFFNEAYTEYLAQCFER